MTISFSVHELNPYMLKKPICMVGILWLDAQGAWLLNEVGLPEVVILDPQVPPLLREQLPPAKDHCLDILLYAWLKTQSKGWALDGFYWLAIKALETRQWGPTLHLREVPAEYRLLR